VSQTPFDFGLSCKKKKPLTRYGILSTVISIYDSLGFLAPVILTGGQKFFRASAEINLTGTIQDLSHYALVEKDGETA